MNSPPTHPPPLFYDGKNDYVDYDAETGENENKDDDELGWVIENIE